MEFFNHIHCKYASIDGFVKLYNDALRYRYMITEKALPKARVLAFWEKHGLRATIDAFGTKRPTLFLWKRKLKEGGGKLESLNNRSRAPKNKRKRIVETETENFIIRQRKIRPRLSKDKIAKLLAEEKGRQISPSTVGRIIADLKKQGKIPTNVRLSYYARTGRLLERKTVKRKKLTRKGAGKGRRPFADRHHCQIHQRPQKICHNRHRFEI